MLAAWETSHAPDTLDTVHLHEGLSASSSGLSASSLDGRSTDECSSSDIVLAALCNNIFENVRDYEDQIGGCAAYWWLAVVC